MWKMENVDCKYYFHSVELIIIWQQEIVHFDIQ